MILTTMLSIFTLLSGSIFANSLDFIHQKHLDSPVGRTEFLTEKLTPFVERATELNREVTNLASEIQALSPELDQAQIIEKTTEMTEKMEELQKMLPTLEQAIKIHVDFKELGWILNKTDSLSAHEQEVLDRIVQIYQAVDLKYICR